MIIDQLESFARYAGLGENFATAVRYVQEHDLYALPEGRTVVDGENVFINVAENVYDRKEMLWEAHREYADVQVVLSGSEGFGWSGLVTDDQTEGPFPLPETASRLRFDLTGGQFVIFLPHEPHSPGNPAGESAPCRKAVIKVRCR